MALLKYLSYGVYIATVLSFSEVSSSRVVTVQARLAHRCSPPPSSRTSKRSRSTYESLSDISITRPSSSSSSSFYFCVSLHLFSSVLVLHALSAGVQGFPSCSARVGRGFAFVAVQERRGYDQHGSQEEDATQRRGGGGVGGISK